MNGSRIQLLKCIDCNEPIYLRIQVLEAPKLVLKCDQLQGHFEAIYIILEHILKSILRTSTHWLMIGHSIIKIVLF